MSLAEQVSLAETALASLKSENESLAGKLALANAETARLAADLDVARAKIETYIRDTSRMQTLLDSAGVLLIEGRKIGDGLQNGKHETPPQLKNGKHMAKLEAALNDGSTGK